MTDLEKMTKFAGRLIEQGKVTEYENNETYTKMVDFIKTTCELTGVLKYKTLELTTMVQGRKPSDTKVYSSECCSISLPTNSFVNIKSFENDVDISRIISHQKGDGTVLMSLVISSYLSSVKGGCNGRLILECIGSVGVGVNHKEMNIQDQTKFFRKFGFRMYGKYNPNHIHMEFKHELEHEYLSQIKRFW